MNRRMLLAVVFIAVLIPCETFSVPRSASHSMIAVPKENILSLGQNGLLQSGGIWILRDGKYSAHSLNQFIVFRKESQGIIGFAYYRDPPDAYCFWGDVDASGEMLIQEIKAQRIHLSWPWVSEQGRNVDLDSAVTTTRISLSNLHVVARNMRNDRHDIVVEVALNELWNALDFCDAFFATMDHGK